MTKIKEFIINTRKFWYLYVILFVTIELLNNWVINIYIPKVLCFIISLVLCFVFGTYIVILGKFLYDKVRAHLKEDHLELLMKIKSLGEHIDELDKKNEEYAQQLAATINRSINEESARIIETVKSATNSTKKEIISVIEGTTTDIQNKIDNKAENFTKLVSNATAEQKKNSDTNKAQISEAILSVENNVKNLFDNKAESDKTANEKIISNIKLAQDDSNKQSQFISEQLSGAIDTIVSTIETSSHKEEKSITDATEKIIATMADFKEKTHIAIGANKALINDLSEQVKDVSVSGITQVASYVSDATEKIQLLDNATKELIKLLDRNLVARIEKEQDLLTKQIGDVENNIKTQLTVVAKTAEDNHITMANKIDSISNYAAEFKSLFEEDVKKFEEYVSQLHSSVIKGINELLDLSEDDSEKKDRKIDLLGRQIAELSQKNNSSLRSIIDLSETNKELLSKASDKIKTIERQQADYEDRLKDDADKRISEMSKYYNSCIEKISLVQTEVEGVTKATAILNSIYAILQNQKQQEIPEKDNSRVEEYKDVESGAVVKNHYKYGKLAFSEMFSGGKKAYDVHYDNDGKITRSRNYNKKGEVITELEFYENGQVKTRTEVITKDGRLKTIVSKFDDKGNKTK